MLVLVVAVVGVAAGSAAAAPAGGWASTTLDPLEPVAPGEAVEVGFTIRQHGVSPVDLDEVAVEVEAADGTTERFRARAEGAAGHYVAEVVFTEPGTYTWRVHQGWFGPYELGSIAVGTASAASVGSDRSPVLRLGLPSAAAILAAVAAADAIRVRRLRSRRAVVA